MLRLFVGIKGISRQFLQIHRSLLVDKRLTDAYYTYNYLLLVHNLEAAYDKKKTVETNIVEKFRTLRDKFPTKWSLHTCDIKGCQNTLISKLLKLIYVI